MEVLAFGGPTDMMLIFFIILLVFGAKKLPELARGMGQAMREFHKAKDEIENELTKPVVDVKVQTAPNKQEYNPSPASLPPAPAAPAVAEAKPKEEAAPQVSNQQLL